MIKKRMHQPPTWFSCSLLVCIAAGLPVIASTGAKRTCINCTTHLVQLLAAGVHAAEHVHRAAAYTR